MTAGRPHKMRTLDTDEVRKPSRGEPVPKLSSVPIASVREHDVLPDAPRQRIVDLLKRDPVSVKVVAASSVTPMPRRGSPFCGLREVD